MDAMHEKRVKAFPGRTAEEIEWAVEPGRTVKTWAYDRQVPGPQVPLPRR